MCRSAATAFADTAQAAARSARSRLDIDLSWIGLHAVRSVDLVDTAVMALEIGFESWRLVTSVGWRHRFRFGPFPWHLP